MQTDQAFPSPKQIFHEGNREDYHEIEAKPGLSKREYAIIHSPVQVPDWFMPEAEMKRPKVRLFPYQVFGKNSDHPQKELYCKYMVEGDWVDEKGEVPQEFKDEVEKYGHDRIADLDALDAYEKKWVMDRYFLWRKFFADKVTGNDYISRPGSPEEIESLESTIMEQDRQIKELKQWKESMIDAAPDYQEIAKVMGIEWGQSVSDKILPWMQEAARLLRRSVSTIDEGLALELDGVIRKFIKHKL